MNDKDRMSKAQTVHCLMDMMSTAKNEFEVEALALACRNILHRLKSQKIGKARRRSMGGDE